jgi:acetate kinase
MGFTPLDGLPMGTRCGALDPGVVLYLLLRKRLAAEEIERMLYHESGWLGVSGVSGDMRDLLQSSEPAAAEAVDLFVYRTAREIGSLAAALGGLDALVFTGGIGENSPRIRESICTAAAWLGVVLDSMANTAGGPCITIPDSRVSAWAIPTHEDEVIARQTWQVISETR